MRLCANAALMPVTLDEIEHNGIDRYSAMVGIYEIWRATQDVTLTEAKVNSYVEYENALREQYNTLKDLPVDEWFEMKHYLLLTDLARVPIAGEYIAMGSGARDPFQSVATVMWMPGGLPMVRLAMNGFYMGSLADQSRWERFQTTLKENGWMETDHQYGLVDTKPEEDDWDWDRLLRDK